MTGNSESAHTRPGQIGCDQSLRQAGHRLRDLGVTTLRVRGKNGRYQGAVSQDMIVMCIAAGGDPRFVTVGELLGRRITPRRWAVSGAATTDDGAGRGRRSAE
jgi:hypothetical protein